MTLSGELCRHFNGIGVFMGGRRAGRGWAVGALSLATVVLSGLTGGVAQSQSTIAPPAKGAVAPSVVPESGGVGLIR